MPEEPVTDSLEELETATEVSESSEKGGEAAEEINFSWDDNEGEEEDSEVQGEPAEDSGEEDEQEGYRFDLGEETQIPSEIHGELGGLAKELGIPGDKAAQLLNKGLEIYQAQHRQWNRQLGVELKQEWGREFESRLKATKVFAARLGREAGLKAEDMGVMMSPYGIRLLDAMRAKFAENGGFAGRAAGTPKLTREQQLDAFYADKEKMAAILDPTHPLHVSANRELNKLHGIDD